MRVSSILPTLGLGLLSSAATTSALAQTHVVKNPDTVVRAVAVWEYTGDLPKPAASRLVPVSIFINRELQDASVYLARPVPFTLQNGTVFEIEKSGNPQGTLELAYARHLQNPDQPRIDDGWFAYGAFKPKFEPVLIAKKSGPLSQVIVSGGKGPHFTPKPDDPSKPDASKADSKSDSRVDRSTAAGVGTTVSASKPENVHITDPDARKPDPDSDSARDDPERPTLKKRTPADRKAANKNADLASVKGTGDLNDDPDRPNLHRGKPGTRLEEQDLPPLTGLPAGMHQVVAVSDAKDRPEHDFTRPWDSDEERAQVTHDLRALALQQIATYDHSAAPVPAPKPALKATTARRKPGIVPASAPPAFANEDVAAYTLSYGGSATYVFSAATASTPARYVTLVAQRESDGALHTALSTVTDAAHLDRTPQLRIIDAVDADASNRASLLFELRAQTTRQFVLYRVIGAHAEQLLAAATPQ